MSKVELDFAWPALLPTSISEDKTVKLATGAIDPQLTSLNAYIDVPSIFANFDQRTGAQLDHMAYSWDATTWRDSWPESLKRSVIQNVVVEKRKRGTLKALKDAVASLGSSAVITEWWQTTPKGQPHTFTITCTLSKFDGVLDAETQEDLLSLIDDAKPVRSHYTLKLVRDLSGGLHLTGRARVLSFARIGNI